MLLAKTEGVAVPHFSVVDFGRMLLPVPPLAEQHRIVAKMDELMSVCEGWSRASQQTERARLLDALLHDALDDPLPARELEHLATR